MKNPPRPQTSGAQASSFQAESRVESREDGESAAKAAPEAPELPEPVEVSEDSRVAGDDSGDDTIGSEQEAFALAQEWFGTSNNNGGS